ncbi:MAG TPA: hypothetical protein VGO47_10645 [Chlamydiales bacterium]|nr:hypothetical protein [Chlamydiales bacterium]
MAKLASSDAREHWLGVAISYDGHLSHIISYCTFSPMATSLNLNMDTQADPVPRAPYPATPGSQWTAEIASWFRIRTVIRNDPVEFFGAALPKELNFQKPQQADFLLYQGLEDLPTLTDDTLWRLLVFLGRLHIGHIMSGKPYESVCNAVGEMVFRMMNFERPGLNVLSTCENIALHMGEPTNAETDVTLMDAISSQIFFVIQENKTLFSRDIPEYQLFAQAIAATQQAQRLARFKGLPQKMATVRICLPTYQSILIYGNRSCQALFTLAVFQSSILSQSQVNLQMPFVGIVGPPMKPSSTATCLKLDSTICLLAFGEWKIACPSFKHMKHLKLSYPQMLTTFH